MTIGQLAKEAGVNVQTVRYYERIGLIDKPATNEAGYRIYTVKAVEVLRFIKHAKEIGFSLKQIAEIFSIDNEKNNTCSRVKKLAQEKVTEIDKKINSLSIIRKELLDLISQCEAKKTDKGDCPMLNVLKFQR